MSRRPQSRHSELVFFFFLYALISHNVIGAERILISDEITPRIRIHHGAIISDSDSLFLNGRLLARDKDYRIDYLNGVISLQQSGREFDTLKMFYTPLPGWLKKHYGIQPERVGTPPVRVPLRPTVQTTQEKYPASSSLTIRGAKKFSISSQTGGTSRFNQSLALAVKGELSPGLEISGSVSDHGYDPVYGTINSRISELDKLNLKIESSRFHSEIGNLVIAQRSDYSGPVAKQVSGIEAAFHDRDISVSALFARPRGQFKTARFNGFDGIQGPYRVIADDQVCAIVPGSERVWVDGRLLERGAEKDYIMDYPSANITFMPRALIDSRSRIEVDFEPLTTEYQREIYQFSAEAGFPDSSIYIRVGFTREGDDKDKLKIGELGTDDINSLGAIGDSVTQNYMDGAIADTLGAYVEKFDSLGFRYFEYVGDSLGDYRVNFSPVGMGQGDYLYDGNNIYRYVGRNYGDYLSVIRIPIPSREDFFEAELGAKPNGNSLIKFIIRQSDFDRNLFSNLHDNNNIGGQYIFSAYLGQSPSVNSDKPGAVVSLNIINKNFRPRARRNRPDLARKYFIPPNMTPNGDERELAAASLAIIPGPYNVFVSSGLLDYERQFHSRFGTVSLYPDSGISIIPFLSYTRLQAERDSSGRKLRGENEIFIGKTRYNIGHAIFIATSFEYDRRWNWYSVDLRGTTEREYDITLKYRTAKCEIQRYYEDTLKTGWERLLRRDRVIFNLAEKIGALKGELYLVGQRLTRDRTKEDQFLARLSASYTPSKRNLSVSGSYALSDENRFERGLRYLEVESGQGRFVFRDGQYIPDPEGDYIEIEEIHSNRASVKKGEKSFNFIFNPRDVYLKLVSNTVEELLAGGNRDLLWILPFYSNDKQPYLYRKLYYSGELDLLNWSGYYFINLAASYNFEARLVGGADFRRFEKVLKVGLNESKGPWRYGQEASYFEYLRDAYYSSPGDIDGFKIALSIIRSLGGGQISGSFTYRFAKDANQSRSKQFIMTIRPRIRSVAGGETSLKLEAYKQELDANGFISYRLTDNMPGKQGINWSLRSDHKIDKDLRFTVSFSGRHSDDRKPRITGRGELIASF